MKTLNKYILPLICLSMSVNCFNSTFAQKAKMSFNSAYNILNGSNKSSRTGSSKVNIGSASITKMNYTKKITISYGVPIEIVLEYAVLKRNLSSDLASDPDTYDNCSNEVQQALVNIAYGNFVKISDYNIVNVKMNFRFNPPLLKVYGSDEGDFLNNTHSSPYDPGVYTTPSTPVSGSKIMVIKK